ncbi:MAG: hypothetical protein JWP36_1236 [Paucimonas sp.]|nr:hypothetical protein [Paucimonas sp.]
MIRSASQDNTATQATDRTQQQRGAKPLASTTTERRTRPSMSAKKKAVPPAYTGSAMPTQTAEPVTKVRKKKKESAAPRSLEQQTPSRDKSALSPSSVRAKKKPKRSKNPKALSMPVDIRRFEPQQLAAPVIDLGTVLDEIATKPLETPRRPGKPGRRPPAKYAGGVQPHTPARPVSRNALAAKPDTATKPDEAATTDETTFAAAAAASEEAGNAGEPAPGNIRQRLNTLFQSGRPTPGTPMTRSMTALRDSASPSSQSQPSTVGTPTSEQAAPPSHSGKHRRAVSDNPGSVVSRPLPVKPVPAPANLAQAAELATTGATKPTATVNTATTITTTATTVPATAGRSGKHSRAVSDNPGSGVPGPLPEKPVAAPANLTQAAAEPATTEATKPTTTVNTTATTATTTVTTTATTEPATTTQANVQRSPRPTENSAKAKEYFGGLLDSHAKELAKALKPDQHEFIKKLVNKMSDQIQRDKARVQAEINALVRDPTLQLDVYKKGRMAALVVTASTTPSMFGITAKAAELQLFVLWIAGAVTVLLGEEQQQ